MTSVGIDIGTFHTLAVGLDGRVPLIPSATIPSIALLGGPTPIVGVDAVHHLDLGHELLQAPKLLLGGATPDSTLLREVMRKLAEQALTSVAGLPGARIVVTVPPKWSLAKCDLLGEALASVGRERLFLHEPVALLVAAWHFASRHVDPSHRAKLNTFREIVVCDWGAGTVDLALVSRTGPAATPTFQCRSDATLMQWGGTSIARAAVDALRAAGGALPVDRERAVFFLQQHWASGTESPVALDQLAPFVSRSRQEAAVAVRCEVERLLAGRSTKDILFVMHGGPLESLELRADFAGALERMGIERDRQLHVGNAFCSEIEDGPANLRREALVALGGALYSEHGRPLPEFQYEVALRDAFGKTTSSVRLAVSEDLRGTQVVNPPYTDVDYSVAIRQMRDTEPTAIEKELALHVRAEAVVRYRVEAAGVGYATVSAQENMNIPVPRAFADARLVSVVMPESSTRFTLDFAQANKT